MDMGLVKWSREKPFSVSWNYNILYTDMPRDEGCEHSQIFYLSRIYVYMYIN